MASPDPTAPIERLAFFDGQQLFATDLGGIDDYNRQMRWLHNQSLHQPGVGKGYAITGALGDRQLAVGAGYALDAMGREIVLTRTVIVPIPPVASGAGGGSVFFDLTVSYPDDSELKATETRQGICLPLGVVRLREEPSFCWVRLESDESGNLQPIDPQLAADVTAALRIVLARAEVLQCKLKQPISTAGRLGARPVGQPYIACGQAAVQWIPTALAGGQGAPLLPFLLTVAVDTSAAAFATTPVYTARIAGERLLSVDPSFDVAAAAPIPVLVEPLLDLSQATPTGFVLEAALVAVPALAGLSFDSFGGFSAWQVVWMGVE
jgi:hypothetical protein